MGPTWERVVTDADRAAWSAVLVPAARDLDADAARLSAEAIEHIRAQVPQLLDDDAAAEENRASTEAGIRAFAALVVAGADPATIELPPPTVAYARAGVRRGDSMAALMRSYRLAVEVILQSLLSHLAGRAADLAQLELAGRLGTAWLFGYMDRALTLGEELYDAERSRWLRSAAATQSETIDALLAGRPQDVAQASQRLRYPLERHHTGAVVWLDALGDGDPLAHLEAAIAQLARALRTDAVLVQPLGLLVAAAWFGGVQAPAAAAFDDLRLDRDGAPGVHAALGEPASGAAGFRATHLEAGHARRVATLAGRRPGTVTCFDRIALVAMATADVDQARAFTARQLGALATDDDLSHRLAATLRVFLEESASRSRAAKRLGIHENTVSYRVRQAEELLGRSVEDRTLELRVALALRSVVAA